MSAQNTFKGLILIFFLLSFGKNSFAQTFNPSSMVTSLTQRSQSTPVNSYGTPVAKTPTPLSGFPTPITGLVDSSAPVVPDQKMQDSMKAHFEEGMKQFHIEDYDYAVPELMMATAVTDKYDWQTWYIEAYNTLGIIYEFHSKEDKHDAYAYMFYSLTLQRDPGNAIANLYIQKVKGSRGDAENLLKQGKNVVTMAETPTPVSTQEANWYPAPPIGPEDQFLHYSVNSYFSNDVNGYNLFTNADIIARRRLDQQNTSAEFDVRFSKNYSTSDNADT